MESNDIYYIISVCLQLAGAEILLFSSWKKLNVSEMANNIMSEINDYGDIDEKPNKEKADCTEIKNGIIISRFAFFEIAMGYILSVFSYLSNDVNRGLVLVLIIVCSLIICAVSCCVSSIMANAK